MRFSAAVVRVEAGGRVRCERAYGRLRDAADSAPCGVDTRFDVASITKVFVAGVALDAVAHGLVALDAPLAAALVPEWRTTEHAAIALRGILAHDAGFKSGADYRLLLGHDVERFALREPLAEAPGTRVIYSDLGFIALGTVLARAYGRALAPLVEERLRAWDAASTAYVPAAPDRRAMPATET
ncbi:MAG: beta-lactamase family protein, partial [Candidatus Eremiobacteraeota bacterium]|nr:beta-lactamase family protein [Candidatus Eremiobacteraeota bacterium]